MKANEVIVPGPEPAAINSEAKMRYWLRPSSYHVLNGVTMLVFPEVTVVPVPMVNTCADNWAIEASIAMNMSSLRTIAR